MKIDFQDTYRVVKSPNSDSEMARYDVVGLESPAIILLGVNSWRSDGLVLAALGLVPGDPAKWTEVPERHWESHVRNGLEAYRSMPEIRVALDEGKIDGKLLAYMSRLSPRDFPWYLQRPSGGP